MSEVYVGPKTSVDEPKPFPGETSESTSLLHVIECGENVIPHISAPPLGSSPGVVGGTYVANSVIDLAIPGISPSPYATEAIHTLRLYTMPSE